MKGHYQDKFIDRDRSRKGGKFGGKAISKCRCPERGLLEGQLVIMCLH